MAIVRIAPTEAAQETPPTELTLTFNNGDYQALRRTIQKLGFKDEESMLRFALAVLTQSATRSLKITNTDGKEITLSPSGSLLSEGEAE